MKLPPENNVTNAIIYLNPPGLEFINSKLTCQHYYTEEVLDRAVEIGNNSGFVCSDFKISGGFFGCRTGYSIMSTGAFSTVNINLHPKTLNNPFIKGLVGFGRLKNSSNTAASIMCKITTQNRYADWTNCFLTDLSSGYQYFIVNHNKIIPAATAAFKDSALPFFGIEIFC